ncbi:MULTISPECIES: hypothetical protein [unclassified Burkholderia]|nr:MULTISPECIES: hypothetical protein [unclassified Burkholderia]
MTDSSLTRLDALDIDYGVSVDRDAQLSDEDIAAIAGWLATGGSRVN